MIMVMSVLKNVERAAIRHVLKRTKLQRNVVAPTVRLNLTCVMVNVNPTSDGGGISYCIVSIDPCVFE